MALDEKADNKTIAATAEAGHPSGSGQAPDQTEDGNVGTVIPFRIQVGLLLFSGMYTMFFSGAVFGWGPMQLMLEQDGAFVWKCSSDEVEELPCESQSATLVNLQLIATLMAVFSPALGMFTDHYGAMKLMCLLAFFGTSGIVLIMVASATETHRLHFLAFALFGLMFVSTTIIIVQTGLVLSGKAQRRVISALTALIDAGTVSFLGLYEIQKATDTSFMVILAGYLGLAVFCFGGAIIFWMALGRVPQKTAKNTSGEPIADTDDESCAQATVDAGGDFMDTESLDKRVTTLPDPFQPSNRYVLIAMRDPWKQLKSKQYILVVVYFSIHLLRNNWAQATARDYLASLGDDEHDNKYTAVFTGLSAASLIGLPFLDKVLSKYGYYITFQAINILGLLHGIIQVTSENLNVQVLGFVIFSFYRCFTFSACFSFLPTFLSGDTAGRACGIMSFFAAVLSLANIGLSEWAINGLGRNFFVPHLILCLVVVPAFYIGLLLRKCIVQENDATARNAETKPMAPVPRTVSNAISDAQNVDYEV